MKEVFVEDRRHIVCLNERQARKDAADRQSIIEALTEKLKSSPKSLVDNKGFRKYLSMDRDTFSLNEQKIKEESRFDGKWVLRTNTGLRAEQVTLKYKELWQVEQAFRGMKSVLDTRPIFHQRDETIRGHVSVASSRLCLSKSSTGDWRKHAMTSSGPTSYFLPWKRSPWKTTAGDLPSGVRARVRGKVFQAVGVAMPATIREVS